MRVRFAYAPLLERCEHAEATCREALRLAHVLAENARQRLVACERARDDAYRALTADVPAALAQYRFLLESTTVARSACVASEGAVADARARYGAARRETLRLAYLRERAAADGTRDAMRRAERELDDANAARSLSHERTFA